MITNEFRKCGSFYLDLTSDSSFHNYYLCVESVAYLLNENVDTTGLPESIVLRLSNNRIHRKGCRKIKLFGRNPIVDGKGLKGITLDWNQISTIGHLKLNPDLFYLHITAL